MMFGRLAAASVFVLFITAAVKAGATPGDTAESPGLHIPEGISSDNKHTAKALHSAAPDEGALEQAGEETKSRDLTEDDQQLQEEQSDFPKGATLLEDKDPSDEGNEDGRADTDEGAGEGVSRLRPKAKGGASSSRIRAMLELKRAQQKASNRQTAAERAQAYYARHGIQGQGEQKEEEKPVTKRYKPRIKSPSSVLEERRQLQQQKQEAEENTKREEEGKKQPSNKDSAITSYASSINSSDSNESQGKVKRPTNNRVFSLRRPSFPKKRDGLKKDEQEGTLQPKNEPQEEEHATNKKKKENPTDDDPDQHRQTDQHEEVDTRQLTKDPVQSKEDQPQDEEHLPEKAQPSVQEDIKIIIESTDPKSDVDLETKEKASIVEHEPLNPIVEGETRVDDKPIELNTSKRIVEEEIKIVDSRVESDPIIEESDTISSGSNDRQSEQKQQTDDARKKILEKRQQTIALRRKQESEQNANSKSDRVLEDSKSADETSPVEELAEVEVRGSEASPPLRIGFKRPTIKRPSIASTNQETTKLTEEIEASVAPKITVDSRRQRPSLFRFKSSGKTGEQSRASSKYKNSGRSDRPIRINTSLQKNESQSMTEIPRTTSVEEINTMKSSLEHLQFLEENPNEKYKFEDSLIEEVTTSHPQGSTTDEEAVEDQETGDGPTPASENVHSSTLVHGFTDIANTNVMSALEALINAKNNAENDDSITTAELEAKENPTTTDFDGFSTELPAIKNNEAGYNMEEYDRQTETVANEESATTTSIFYSTSTTSRPFRDSLYNRRPGNRLKEIMERRTASTSPATTPSIPPSSSPLSTIIPVDEIIEGNDYVTGESDQSVTEIKSVDNSVTSTPPTLEIRESDEVSASPIPVDALNVITVTTHPIEYRLASSEGEGHDSLSSHDTFENDSLNLADQFERMNIIGQTISQKTNPSDDSNVQDYGILGAIKNVVAATMGTSQPEFKPSDNATQAGTIDKDLTDIYDASNGNPELENEPYYYSDDYETDASTTISPIVDINVDRLMQSIVPLINSEKNETKHLINPELTVSNLDEISEGMKILRDGFYYPASQEASQTSVSKQPEHAFTKPDSSQKKIKDATVVDYQVSTGLSVKDASKASEVTFDPTDIAINQVRTDRKNILDSNENSGIQEMIIENDDPNGPPLTLIVRPNSGRIDVGDQDTFDISVSSSLYTEPSSSKSVVTRGQVLPDVVENNNGGHNSAEPMNKNSGGDTRARTSPSTSLVDEGTENNERTAVGIGQVIPVDLNHEDPVENGHSQGIHTKVEDKYLEEVTDDRDLPEVIHDEKENIPANKEKEREGLPVNATEDKRTVPQSEESAPSVPSFFGALLDIFTRPERPRPARPERRDDVSLNETEKEQLNDREEGSNFPRRPRPPVFRPQKPNHQYRPFRPDFRPPPPNRLRPGFQIPGNDRGQFGQHDGRPLRPPGLRPSPDYDGQPSSSSSHMIHKTHLGVNDPMQPLPNVPNFGMLPPAPLDASNISSESFDNSQTEQPVTEVVQEDTKFAENFVEKFKPSTSEQSSTPPASNPEETNGGSKVNSSMPPVIAIDGFLEDFINQLDTDKNKQIEAIKKDSLAPTDAVSPLPTSHVETDSPNVVDHINSERGPDTPNDVNSEDVNQPITENLLSFETELPNVQDESNIIAPSVSNASEYSPSVIEFIPKTAVDSKVETQTLMPSSTTLLNGSDTKPSSDADIEAFAPKVDNKASSSQNTNATTTSDVVENIGNELQYDEYDSEGSSEYYDYGDYNDSSQNSTTEASMGENQGAAFENTTTHTSHKEDSSVVQHDSTGENGSLDQSGHAVDRKPITDQMHDFHSGVPVQMIGDVTTSIESQNFQPDSKNNTSPPPHLHEVSDGSFVGSKFSDTDDREEPKLTVVLPGSRPVVPFVRPSPHKKQPTKFSLANRLNKDKFSDVISPPLIETGFQALKPDSETEDLHESDDETHTRPTGQDSELPPSLPNLQIIPFVAADAVKKAEDNVADESSPLGAGSDFTDPSAASIPGQHELCWSGGQLLGEGIAVNFTDDPCQSCRCYFGQLICRTQECQEVPSLCRAVDQPGECCPLIVCEHELRAEEPIPTDEIIDSSYDDYPDHPTDYAEESDDTRKRISEAEVDRISSAGIRSPEAKQPPALPSKPTLSDGLMPPKPLVSSDEKPRPLVPSRLLTIKTPISRHPSSIDRSDLPPIRRKPSVVGTRPTLPFIQRNRPGERPTFLPPRKSSLDLSSPTKLLQAATESAVSESTTEPSRLITTYRPLSLQNVVSTTAVIKDSPPVSSDFASFLEKVSGGGSFNPDFLLPKPIQPTTPLESGEIENILLRNNLQYADNSRDATKPRTTAKPILPDIPDEVKSQLPLGIDAILASGAFQLSGCNIYGREYVVGDSISELSAPCKACRCTPVGVQCLPIC
ncbi:uncharacterized protein LOC108682933 [Hyalella azteca]|uniref:Uncharacterized protein LOC108682933 n=1 Tax=Hyalella azteca TaxID=294128 RepID=A0A8B7PN98_HYAAZ|nr:uncharacterized protein LOC108682933 [Hyalella azteca]